MNAGLWFCGYLGRCTVTVYETSTKPTMENMYMSHSQLNAAIVWQTCVKKDSILFFFYSQIQFILLNSNHINWAVHSFNVNR